MTLSKKKVGPGKRGDHVYILSSFFLILVTTQYQKTHVRGAHGVFLKQRASGRTSGRVDGRVDGRVQGQVGAWTET